MKNIFKIALLIPVILWNACSPKPFSDSNNKYKRQAKVYSAILKKQPRDSGYWIGTSNFNMRKPNYVIIHHTAQSSCGQTLKTFTNDSTQVSAHYVICKDGTLHHMLNDYLRAWHAGAAKWGNETDLNSSSIGIELDNNGIDSFSEAALNTLLELLTSLKKRI